jgi:hypothetical protein
MPYGDKKSYGFFKMKYQGNNSAFPFKSSPMLDDKKVDHDANLKKIKDDKKRTEYYKKHNLKQDLTTSEGKITEANRRLDTVTDAVNKAKSNTTVGDRIRSTTQDIAEAYKGVLTGQVIKRGMKSLQKKKKK